MSAYWLPAVLWSSQQRWFAETAQRDDEYRQQLQRRKREMGHNDNDWTYRRHADWSERPHDLFTSYERTTVRPVVPEHLRRFVAPLTPIASTVVKGNTRDELHELAVKEFETLYGGELSGAFVVVLRTMNRRADENVRWTAIADLFEVEGS